MSNDNDGQVDEACLGLRKAVQRYSFKHEHRFRGSDKERERGKKVIQQIVQHGCHILTQLYCRRASLESATEALKECWKVCNDSLGRSSDLDNLKHILQHFFRQYLRIRDGMVLLESGECRHEGDLTSLNATFSSHLTKNNLRGDGYTMLYSQELSYSGYAWDEFWNEDFGVKARLLRALRKLTAKAVTWDTLLNLGSLSFETAMDLHETKIKATRKVLEDLRVRVNRDLLQLLKLTKCDGKVHFITRDKLESLEVQYGSTTIKLQRRADEFNVTDEGGALPPNRSFLQWKRVMKLPNRFINNVASVQRNGSKIKKRVIIDSSDDEDQAPSLFVLERKSTVDARLQGEEKSSLNAIKTSFGVDSIKLESSLETLEAEQSHLQSNIITSGLENTVAALRATIGKLKREVERATTCKHNVVDIWDMRELLRQQSMQLGIELLTNHQQVAPSPQGLSEASELFKKASDLVAAQQAAHTSIIRTTNDTTEGAWLVARRLLLLKGRAHVNGGIALLELSLLQKAPVHTRTTNRSTALKELREAADSVASLQQLSRAHRKQGASVSETSMNLVEATQLETIVLRTEALVHWHDGKRETAVRNFFEAASTYNKFEAGLTELAERDPCLHEEYLANVVECYHVSTLLFDLACSRVHSSLPAKGEEFFNIAIKASQRAKELIDEISRVAGMRSSTTSMNRVEKEHNIGTTADINNAVDGVRDVWKKKEQHSLLKAPLNVSHVGESPWPDRSDVGASILSTPGRGGHIIGASTAGRKRPARSTQEYVYKTPELSNTDTTMMHDSIVYMDWGDERLSSNSLSAEVPLGFPFCAPPPRPSPV